MLKHTGDHFEDSELSSARKEVRDWAKWFSHRSPTFADLLI